MSIKEYKNDIKIIVDRYNERLEKFGSTNEALSVGTDIRRNIRFNVLKEIGDIKGKKVLDLGCGFGDLLDFLRQKNISCDYTGFDINSKMIEIARTKHISDQFRDCDILAEDFGTFDYILSSTTFNNKFRYTDNYEAVENILKTTYNHCKEGVAIDFLTSYVDYKKQYAFYYEPEKIFSIAKKITRRVCLRHDYPLFEFCIYLYKDTKFPY